MEALINFGEDLNQLGEGRKTPLMFAAKYRHEESVLRLVHAGADLNCVSTDMNTALSYAASNGLDESVKALIDAGADVNFSGSCNETPLHLAASYGSVACVKNLLRARANPRYTTAYRQTPLHMAAMYAHEEVVKVLCKSGSFVDVATKRGETALMFAARSGLPGCVVPVLNCAFCVNQVDIHNRNALHYALDARYPCDDCVKWLIHARIDVNVADAEGLTPLHMAIMKDLHSCVEILLQANADVEAGDSYGFTPLMIAAQKGMVRTTKLLLDAGARVNHATPLFKSTALIHAAKQGQLECLSILLDAGANINQSNLKDTPLMCAVNNGHLSCVQMLLKRHAWVNASGRLPRRSIVHDNEIKNLLTAAGQEFHTRPASPEEERNHYPRTLQDLSRATTRNHLMAINNRENLFSRVPQLPLPTRVKEYLLFNVSVDAGSESDDEDDLLTACSRLFMS